MQKGRPLGKSKGKSASKALEDGEFIIKRRMHLSVVLGITLCVIGGAVVASSFLLDWVQGGSGNETVWSLVEMGGIYYLTILIPLSGLLSAMLSSLDVLAEKGRKRFKAPASLGALACGLFAIISVTFVALQINDDFVQPNGDSFGPAMFMSVFGGVLALSGGMVLTIDYLEARARRGRFTASGGSSELRAVLRAPTRSQKPSHAAGRMQDGGAEGTMGKGGEFEDIKATGLECPNCYSPVQPNWSICPICGQELL